MNKYKNLHLWMIIPMLIMQLGIFVDYWGDLTENAWAVHVHYWTGTAWYLFLIFQPYWATHGQIVRHRTVGIIGMFVGGGVCLTALAMMHRDIVSAEQAAQFPERFGPFQPWFFYGVTTVEIVMMVAFGVAVIMSILRRKQIKDHSWWLMSSVFLIMNPALGRGLGNLSLAINAADMPNVDIMFPLYVTQAIILSLVLLAAWKFGTLRHPATYLAVAVNLFLFLWEPIGRSPSVQAFFNAAIKG